MYNLRMVLCCMLLTFMALPVLADEVVSLKVGYLHLTPTGTLAGTLNGFGTRVDVEDDLNLEDSDGVTAEIAFQLGRSRLSLGYLPLEYTGTGMMTISGFYNGQPFSQNDVVRSEMKLDIYDLGYTFNLLDIDDGPFRLQLGPELAVKIVDGEVDFNTDSLVPIDEHDSATIPIPTLGARARVGLSDYLAVVARFGYSEYEDNNFLDAEAQVEFSPLPLVGFYAGYRTFSLEVDESDITADVDFKGPFVGALFRF